MKRNWAAFIAAAACGIPVVYAGGVPTALLEEVKVTARRLGQLQGMPLSASQGVVGAEQLENRPMFRPGELLEVVPGLIVTQHSGDGKANQYFLRGFNLDHGTDLATSVDGVPVNMPTHGHGQGYTDINFVIPELVESIEYRKGTYYAETGNFSAAGAVDLRYRQELEAPLMVLEGGQYGYSRALLAGSPRIGEGRLLVGLAGTRMDGPWLLDENLRKLNGLLRYSLDTSRGALTLDAQAYDGRWNSTDQVPQRAVDSGALDRFGTIDPTSGGSSHRYSLAANLSGALGGGRSALQVYVVDYGLDLFSNFSYYTDPDNGDQFEQVDRRHVFGGDWSWRQAASWLGREQEITTGLQLRHDDIGEVGLYRTRGRERLQVIREDAVRQTSYGAFASLGTRWHDKLRTSVGLRADRFVFDVDAGLAVNSGRSADAIVSPKFTLVLGPWRQTEFFFNAGRGFHSNDARGTTISVDPLDGVTPAEKVDALVGAGGFDLGVRTALFANTQFSLSLWQLAIDSELLFIGDAGTTEASRASRRQGIEAALIWNPVRWLVLDADLAVSRSRFTDADPAGRHIPGAVGGVASVGMALEHPSGWFGGLRFRHFGAAPLIEDNSVRSNATTLLNVEAGYRLLGRYKLGAGLYNLLGSRDNDITYFYESQLPGETAPVADRHFHPVEPRTLRVTLSATF